MIRVFKIILITVVLFNTVHGHDNVEIIKSDEISIVLAIKPIEISFREIIIDGLKYDKIEASDQFTFLNKSGFPQVPMIGLLLGIPFSTSPMIQILEAQYKEIRDINLCPSPDLRFNDNQSGGFLSEIFKSDGSIYSSNQCYPGSVAEIVSRQKFRSQNVAKLELYPIQYNPTTKVLRKYTTLKVEIVYQGTTPQQSAIKLTFENNAFDIIQRKLLINHSIAKKWRLPDSKTETLSKPTTNNWYRPDQPFYKLLISQDGIYHLDYEDLLNNSIPISGVDPRTIQIFYLGVEIPIFIAGESDGVFDPQDYIEFYAQQKYGEETYFDDYTNTNVYWLTFGGANGKRMVEKVSASDNLLEISSFSKKTHFEKDLSYHHGDNSSTVIDTEPVPGEGWFWKRFYKNEEEALLFELENVDLETSDLCSIKVRLRGTTIDAVKPDHHAIFSINGTYIGDAYFDNTEEIIFTNTFNAALLRGGVNELTVKSEDTGAEINSFYLDWFDVSYRITNQAKHGRLNFHVEKDQTAQISLWNFSSDTVGIYNLTQNYRITNYEVKNEQRFIFKVLSAGFEDGNFAYVRINSDYAIYGGQRGHNLVVFDPATGIISDKRWFDTLDKTENSDSLAAYISRIPAGRIVLVAIRDEGSYRMTEAAHQALESLGSVLTRQVQYRDSWALIGRKGVTPGSVPEMLVPKNGGEAILTDTLVTSYNFSKHILFQDQLQAGDEFIITSLDSILRPDLIIKDEYKNLANSQWGADYIFITHEKFKHTAQQIANFWAERNYRPFIVDIQDIYDEFNFGIKHPKAIKDFLAFTYANWNTPAPAFVLLIGDASWDPKKNSPTSIKEDYIPTVGNPVTDHWYVCFDGDNDILPEMFIGRLAIETNDHGEQIFQKILTYENLPSAEWKKQILFINGGFDDSEQLTFGRQTEKIIRSYVTPPPASCVPQVISKELDGLYEGEKREDIAKAINDGKLWVNFIGHGGSGTWELMFHDEQVFQLQNGDRLPFVTSLTCHTGRFANPEITNFGENFLNTPNAGAIGFTGSSGWGFVYEDEQFARKLFETVLVDTVHQLGAAITLAKIKFWGAMNHNVITKSVMYQYSLLGDPAVNLTLPEQPDLVVKQNSLSWEPYSPVEQDSVILLNIQVKNFGLATTDSVLFKINDHLQSGGSAEIFNGKIKPIGFADSMIVPWRIANLAGQHALELTIDPDDHITEADENNNQATFSMYIGSSRITVSKPMDNQIVTMNRPLLQINNPVTPKSDINYYFEIDTTLAFNSDFLMQSGPIPQGILVTNWMPPASLREKTVYYWRCRSSADESESSWITASFLIDAQFGWRQQTYQQFQQNKVNNLELTKSGVTLAKKMTTFHLESAGLDDGNYAVIFVNSVSVAAASRGHNIAVCDFYGNFLEFRSFDTHDSPVDVDSMVIFLNQIPDGYYVLIVIRDSGEQSMNESAYQALEGIGSQYCREVELRDSWAIIGKKRAAIGAMPEKLVRRFEGKAILSDTLITYQQQGEMNSTIIGPSNGWKTLAWNSQQTDATLISMDVLAFDKQTSQWQTLLTNLTNKSGVSLSNIISRDYPIIKLKANLKSEDGFSSPLLENWSVDDDPVSDLAIGEQVVTFSADTVIEGASIILTADIYNVGYVAADSVNITFLDQNANHGKTSFGEVTLSSIQADSHRTVQQEWNSIGNIGVNQIFIELDPADHINELTNDNNYYSKQVVVLSDTTGPEINLTFDGKQIVDGEYVSKQPTILITVFDNSPLSIQNDTAKIHLFMDGVRINYSGNEAILFFNTGNDRGDSTFNAQVKFMPQLTDGDHTLEIFVKDASANSAYRRTEFKVVSEVKILNVMNYPNPFRDHTYFTYFFTQPADEVAIKIFTIAGRLIRKIENAPGEAGFNKVFWDGLDQDYDELANGVYLYKIIARTEDKQVEAIEKLVVMR